jgi:hypothetical protein
VQGGESIADRGGARTHGTLVAFAASGVDASSASSTHASAFRRIDGG